MKILAITASPRGSKSRTLQLVEAVAKGARVGGAQVEIVDVCKQRILYCNGCGACYATGVCVLRDDLEALSKKMLACEGLIFASPNYFRGVTAQLKTLLDRMADTIHCQLFTGKYACSVGTAGGPTHREVTDYLGSVLVGLGASVVGAVGASPAVPGAMDAALPEAEALGKELADAIRTLRRYPEQDATHEMMRTRFKQLVMMNKDLWRHEYEYWHGLGEL